MEDSSERSLLLLFLLLLHHFLLFSRSNLRLFRFRHRPRSLSLSLSLSHSRRAWMVTAHAPLLFLALESRASVFVARADLPSLSLSPPFSLALSLACAACFPLHGLPRPALTSVYAELPRVLVEILSRLRDCR